MILETQKWMDCEEREWRGWDLISKLTMLAMYALYLVALWSLGRFMPRALDSCVCDLPLNPVEAPRVIASGVFLLLAGMRVEVSFVLLLDFVVVVIVPVLCGWV